MHILIWLAIGLLLVYGPTQKLLSSRRGLLSLRSDQKASAYILIIIGLIISAECIVHVRKPHAEQNEAHGLIQNKQDKAETRLVAPDLRDRVVVHGQLVEVGKTTADELFTIMATYLEVGKASVTDDPDIPGSLVVSHFYYVDGHLYTISLKRRSADSSYYVSQILL